MTLSDLTHATVEQVDEAIVEAKAIHEASLKDLHRIHLEGKRRARVMLYKVLKKLGRYREVLLGEQRGGDA